MLKNIDRQQCLNLLIGIIGVYSCYLINAVFHEQLIKYSFYNYVTGKEDEAIRCPEALVAFPTLIGWILVSIYNKKMINPNNRVKIPEKNGFFCGLCVFVSTFTYTLAVIKTSFPVVMVFKSSNILSVLLIAIFCSRVTQQKLKLGKKKLITGAFLTIGVFLFNFFDPETKNRNNKTQVIGILLLIVSLLADGFLPDFQAQIKSVYKPQPSEMLAHVNKWVTIIGFVVLIVNKMSIIAFAEYMMYHRRYTIYMFIFSILSVMGQMFIYRLIKQFKQHIVPFVVTSRKIVTILISVFYLGHDYRYLQFTGVLIIFLTVTYEFISELRTPEKKTEKFEKSLTEVNNLSSIQNTQRLDFAEATEVDSQIINSKDKQDQEKG